MRRRNCDWNVWWRVENDDDDEQIFNTDRFVIVEMDDVYVRVNSIVIWFYLKNKK